MRIYSVRDLEGLIPVLKDEKATGPDPVYWVFKELGHNKWINMTLLTSGVYAGEYAKTFGHYHGDGQPEIYHVVCGKALIVLQKIEIEKGLWVGDRTTEVLLVSASSGQDVNINPAYAHALVNVGEEPLITFDNREALHPASDYAPVERHHGLAYYIINEDGQPKAVPNPNYSNLPEPVWLSAPEYEKRG